MTTRSRWEDEETAAFRDAVARFMDAEMVPMDESWRHQGHVGHDIWRQVGAQGMLCVDIPESYGGAGGDFRDDAVMTEANALAERLAKGPTVAMGQIRKLVRQAQGTSLSDAMNAEAEAQRIAGNSEDFVEGVTAFLGKREAQFKGR